MTTLVHTGYGDGTVSDPSGAYRGGLIHEFIAPNADSPRRVLPRIKDRLFLGDYQDSVTAAGGFISMAGSIPLSEYQAFPSVYAEDATWLARDSRNGQVVCAGTIRAVAVSGGRALIVADGDGKRADWVANRMLFATVDLDIFAPGDQKPFPGGDKSQTYKDDYLGWSRIECKIRHRDINFHIPPHTAFNKEFADFAYTAITGTVTVNQGEQKIVGSGTTFKKDIRGGVAAAIGSHIMVGTEKQVIETVESDTLAIITGHWGADQAGATMKVRAGVGDKVTIRNWSSGKPPDYWFNGFYAWVPTTSMRWFKATIDAEDHRDENYAIQLVGTKAGPNGKLVPLMQRSLAPEDWASRTGTVSAIPGSVLLNGTGTTFTSQLAIGNDIRIDGTYIRRVVDIISDTQIEVGRPFKKRITNKNWEEDVPAVHSIDFIIPDSYDAIGVRLLRLTETDEADERNFWLRDVWVGSIAKSTGYTLDRAYRELFTRMKVYHLNVASSSVVMVPYDVSQQTMGQIADDISTLDNWFWRIVRNMAGKPKGEAGRMGATKWHVVDPNAPVELLPEERYTGVRYTYNYGGGYTAEAIARPTVPPPAGVVENIYDLQWDQPPYKDVAQVFAQAVADYLATTRLSGSVTAKTIRVTSGGSDVASTLAMPGDSLILDNYNNVEVPISELSHDASGLLTNFTLSTGMPLLEKWLARRTRLLALGRTPAEATILGLGTHKPRRPPPPSIGFKHTEARSGAKKYNAILDWDAVTTDIDGNPTKVRRYEVRIRPFLYRKPNPLAAFGFYPVPASDGGGWRTHTVRAPDDDDPTTNWVPTREVFKDLENPHKWYWGGIVKSVDVAGRESVWSEMSPIVKPAAFGPPPPRDVEVHVMPHQVRVEWDLPPDPNDTDDWQGSIPHSLIKHLQVQLSTDGFTTVLRSDRYVHGMHKTFRVPKVRGITFSGRVRSVDAYGNKSAWVTIAKASITPPQVSGVSITYSKRDRHRHHPPILIVKWKELNWALGDLSHYVVEAQSTDRGDPTFAGAAVRTWRHVVDAADDTDPGTYAQAHMGRVNRRRLIRVRVRAVSTAGAKGPFSRYYPQANGSAPTSQLAPPQPVNVTHSGGASDKIVTEWDPPIVYTQMDGTVSGSGTNLTGTGTAFLTQVGPGQTIRVGSDVRLVVTVADDTHLTVDSSWTGTPTNQIIEIEEIDPDVAHFQVQIAKNSSFNPIYKKDMYTATTKKTWKVDDPLAAYSSRVRAVDQDGNKSAWVNGASTVAPTSGTDGAPASAPPTGLLLQGGVGFLYVKWTPPANFDPLTYEVHISKSAGFTPSAGTFLFNTTDSAAIIKTFNDGTPLQNATTYYVIIRAKDADGPSSYAVTTTNSAPVSGTTVKAQGNGNIVTNATWSAGVATITTSAPHHLAAGVLVDVTNVNPSGYNGTGLSVTSIVDAFKFRYNVAVNPGAYVSGGQTKSTDFVVSDLEAGSITADSIAALSITGDRITAGAITADKITVTDLNTISGATIAGWVMDTAAIRDSGSKVFLESATPRLRVNDGTRDRVFVGKIGTQYGVQILDSAGNLAVDMQGSNSLIAGWTIGAAAISATNISLIPGAANTANIVVGTGANSGGLGSPNAGTDIAIWAGAAFANRATAPFRVTAAGALVATSATITGSISATSGTIGGFSVSSTDITATNLAMVSGAANTARITVGTGSNLAGLNSANAGSDIAIWAGAAFASRATAPFRVDAAGNLTASSVTLTGGSIVGSIITSGISATNITAGTLDVARISAGTITLDKVDPNARPGIGYNFITNGGAELGTTLNFSDAKVSVVTAADLHAGQYAFQVAFTASQSVFSDEFIPVDQNLPYLLSVWARFISGTGAQTYLGLVPYTYDKAQLQSQWVNGTSTTLNAVTVAITSGDTVINIDDTTNYTVGQYVAFDAKSDGSDLPNRTVRIINSKTGTTLTIGGGGAPANYSTSTFTRPHTAGATYIYLAASGVTVPAAWTQYQNRIQGWPVLDSTHHNGSEQTLGGTAGKTFRYGTAFVKILIGHFAASASTIQVDSMEFGPAIDTTKIMDGAVVTNSIAAGAVTANKITVADLQALGATIGGWTINVGSISATNIVLTPGGANVANILVGTGANAAGLNSANAGTDIAFWAGATYANRATAPFRVTAAGALTATSATITGSISATSGTIGGFTVGASTITATNLVLTSGAANTANILVGTGANAGGLGSPNAGTDIAIWAGDTFANRATAPFRVTAAGALTATSATITGSITSTSGTIGGWTIGATTLTGTSVTLDSAGAVSVGSGAAIVKMQQGVGLWAGNAAFGSGPFRVDTAGNLTATNATITGNITATTLTATGSGSIGGWSIGASALTGGQITLDAANAAITVVDTQSVPLTRVKVGKLGSSGPEYGVQVFDSLGLRVFDTNALYGALAAAITTTGQLTVNVTEGGTNSYAVPPVPFTVRVDSESMLITARVFVSGTTYTYTMTRGYNGSTAATHLNAASVWAGSAIIQNTVLQGTALTLNVPDMTTSSSFHVDTTGQMWVGANATGAATAPFRVTAAGALTATSATITGSITSTSGSIGGWTIGSTTITATNLVLTSGAANTANVLVGTGATAGGLGSPNAGTDIAIWAGSTFANRATAPFRVNAQGDLTATSATITGSITSTSGSIGGFTIGATTITATNLVLTSGAANTANILVGTGANAGGLGSPNAGTDIAIWAGSTFANRATAAFNVTAAGALTATSATITGSITASSGAIGGFTISASAITATNLVLTSGAANTANILVGTGANAAGLNSANAGTDIAIWAGSTFANRATAPFRVTAAGAITSTSGTIGGWTIASTIAATNLVLTPGAANVANITAGTGATAGGINAANAGTDIVFWAGDTYANRAVAEFRVDAAGNLTATSATITGGSVSGGIVSSGLDASVITVGTLSAARIAAGTLTVDKLIMGDVDNVVADPSIENGQTTWVLTGNWSALNDNTKARTGNWCLQYNGTSGLVVAMEGVYHPTSPGQLIYAEMWSYSPTASAGSIAIFMRWYDKDKVLLSGSTGNGGRNATYTLFGSTFTAPASAAYFQVGVVTGGVPNGIFYVDDFYCRRVIGNAIISDLSAAKITSGTIAASQMITAGTAGSNRVEIDPAGIRLYQGASTLKADLNVASGSLTMTGGLVSGGNISGAAVDVPAAGQAGFHVDSAGIVSIPLTTGVRTQLGRFLTTPTYNSALTGVLAGTASGLTLLRPDDYNDSDILIAAIAFSGGTGTTITPPNLWGGGTWQLLGGANGRKDNTTQVGVALYWAFASQVGFSTSWTWAFSPVANASGAIYVVSNAELLASNLNNTANAAGQTNASGTTHTTPSITPDSDNDIIFRAFAGLGTNTWSGQTGRTEASDAPSSGTSAVSLGVDYVVLGAATSGVATGTATATASVAVVGAAVTVAIRPNSYPLRHWDGTTTFFAFDAGGRAFTSSMVITQKDTATTGLRIVSAGAAFGAAALTWWQGDTWAKATSIGYDASFRTTMPMKLIKPLETNVRIALDPTASLPSIAFGDGTNDPDVVLARSAANFLNLAGNDTFVWGQQQLASLDSADSITLPTQNPGGLATPKRRQYSQKTVNNSAGGGITIDLPSNSVANNTIVLIVAWNQAQGNITAGSMTWSGTGGPFTLASAVVSNSSQVATAIYTIVNAGVGKTSTLNWTGTADVCIWVAEYIGLVTASLIDVQTSSTGTSATADSGTTAATNAGGTNGNEAWLAVLASKTDDNQTAPTNGFVQVANMASANGAQVSRRVRMGVYEKIVTGLPTNSLTANVSATIDSSRAWAGKIVTLKAGTGAADAATPATGLGSLYVKLQGSRTAPFFISDSGAAFDLRGPSLAAASSSTSNATTGKVAHATYTVPANTVQAGTTYRITAAGRFTTTATSHVCTVQPYWGGTGGVALTPPITVTTSTTAGTGRDFIFQWYLTVYTIGATGTIRGYSWGFEKGSVVTTNTPVSNASGTAVTIDTTAAKDLVLVSSWDSIATNADTINVDICTIELVKG